MTTRTSQFAGDTNGATYAEWAEAQRQASAGLLAGFQAIGAGLIAGFEAAAEAIDRLHRRSRRHRSYRRTVAALHRLDDRTLRDIGLHRSEIRQAALQVAEQKVL